MDTSAMDKQPKLLGKRFKWLRVFLLAYVISEVALIAGNGLSLANGSIMFGPNNAFTIGDAIAGLAAVTLLVAFILCIIWFCMFSYRAMKNLYIWECKTVEMSPGWAVGWHFIPIANLWKPYQAMDQIWDGTHELEKPAPIRPSMMPIWWMCWVVTNIASNISFRLSLNSGMLEDYASNVPLYKTSLMIDVFSSVIAIIAVVAILPILKTITDKQDFRIEDTFS